MEIDMPESEALIVLPEASQKMSISLDKSKITVTTLSHILDSLLNRSIKGGEHVFHGRNDPTAEHLEKMTGVLWAPSLNPDYSNEITYKPLIQGGVDEQLRADREIATANTFLPPHRRPELATKQWIEEQQHVESSKQLPTTTCLPTSIANAHGKIRPSAYEQQEYWRHQQNSLNDTNKKGELQSLFKS